MVDLFDVWVGGPALAGRVSAADYRIEFDGIDDPAALAEAARALLTADRLPRVRLKGGVSVAYDLRPLLVDVAIADPVPPLAMRIRTRFHPELGTGRPEEVIAALGDALGRPLEVSAIVRERLILADELAS